MAMTTELVYEKEKLSLHKKKTYIFFLLFKSSIFASQSSQRHANVERRE